MVANISFTSTYKVSNQNNGYDKFSSFQDLALEKECEKGVGVSLKDGYETGIPYSYNNYVAQYTLTVPDSMDSEVEQYCLYNNIRYTKLTNRELLKPETIEKRITEPDKGMTLAKVNSQKLNKLISDQYSNFKHCKSDYAKYYKDSVDFMIKSGDEIPAPTLSINPDSSDVNSAIRYIKRYGIENIEPGLLFISLDQRTSNPEHCMFFAFQELGMKNIPVYMDINTYKIANALGIIEE